MYPNRVSALFIMSATFVVILAGLLEVAVSAAVSQATGKQQSKTVWDGVYTVAQADRGRSEYQVNCARCHATGEGPQLVGDAFMRRWFDETLNTPFTKIRRMMPGDAPGALTENVYVDILSFLLSASGFPAGTRELSANPVQLGNILIVGRDGPGGPVPDFSLVQVIGCLTRNERSAWTLTNSTEPVLAKNDGDSSPADLKSSESTPLGRHAFRLLDFPSLGRLTLQGHKVQVKGLLMRQPSGDDHRINPTSLQSLGQSCAQ